MHYYYSSEISLALSLSLLFFIFGWKFNVIYKLYKTFKDRERKRVQFIAQLFRRERERENSWIPMTAGIDFWVQQEQ